MAKAQERGHSLHCSLDHAHLYSGLYCSGCAPHLEGGSSASTEPTPHQQDTQGVPTHSHCHRCALPCQFVMQSLRSNAALLVAPVSLTSGFVLACCAPTMLKPAEGLGQTILFCEYPTPASNCLMHCRDYCMAQPVASIQVS